MLVASRHGRGFGAAAAYACSGGVCRASNPTQQALFMKLQKELNRVRPMFGLAADVGVDGVIGAGTLAKLMKLAAKFIGDRDNARFDQVFDKYGIDLNMDEGGALPTTAVLAADALNIVQALERNGLTMQHYWAAQEAGPTPTKPPAPPPSPPASFLDFWAKKIGAGSIVTNPLPQVPVGPTAPPGSNVIPSPTPGPTPFSMKSKGVVAVGVTLGVLAVAGLALGLLKRHNA